MTFGDYISTGRHVRGITLRELGTVLDLDVSIVSKIEKNWRQFPKDKLSVLANEFQVPYQEVLKEYVKSDLIRQYGSLPNYRAILLDILNENKDSNSITEVLKGGESKNVEFKSSLRYCFKTFKPEKYIEQSSLKNICAFLNSNGGQLILGVSDDKEILGLEEYDFKTFSESDKKDSWLKHLDNLISTHFGDSISQYLIISFEKVDSKVIASINVLPNNNGPTFLKNSKNGLEEFYVRRSASAIALTMEEFYKYCKERWQ